MSHSIYGTCEKRTLKCHYILIATILSIYISTVPIRPNLITLGVYFGFTQELLLESTIRTEV